MKIQTLLAIGILEAVLAAAPAAAAERAPAAGPEVAVRLGYALPTGDVQANQSLDRGVSNTVPLILEGGYRVDPSIFVGARLQYAFANFKSANNTGCSGNNVSCDGSDVTLSVEGIYRFVPETVFAPWLGLGGGWEWLNENASTNVINASGSVDINGFQAFAQFGGDVRVTSQLVLGPFVEVQFGRYGGGTTSTTVGNTTTTMDVNFNNTAWHEWIGLGVRGAFGF
jgi:hypothetical protein